MNATRSGVALDAAKIRSPSFSRSSSSTTITALPTAISRIASCTLSSRTDMSAHHRLELGPSLGRLIALDPHPGGESQHAERAVHDVHRRARVELCLEQQRYADHVDRDPDQPELDPATRHPVGGEHRAGQYPGVPLRSPRAERLQYRVEHGVHHDRETEQLDRAAQAEHVADDLADQHRRTGDRDL